MEDKLVAMERNLEKTLSNAGVPAAREDIILLPTESEYLDGGWRAWIQVAGAFTLLFNSWGVVNTYGVYQTYYETTFLTSSTPDAISWIGSIQGFLLLGFGLVAGPLFDAGYFTQLISAGTVAISFGFMMTSVSTQYWHIILAQGFCIGLGAGCLVTPGLALLSQYFDKKRALAVGLAVCGGSLGGVIYPLAFQGLISKVGFGWTNRILGFISLTTCSFAVASMRLRDKPRKVRSLLDTKALREMPYIFFCMAFTFSNLGFFVPIFYIQTYALGHGLTDENIALHLVAILNAASIIGRLTPSIFVVRFGALNTLVGVGILVTAVTFSWMAVQNGPANVVFTILFGFASGGIVSMPPVVLASITDDLSFFGARLGMANFTNAIASLIGPPVAGAILKSMGQYVGVQLFAGLAMLMFTCAGLGCRLARAGLRFNVKV